MFYVIDVFVVDSFVVFVYFEVLLCFEIDCWDVYDVFVFGMFDFVLFDVCGFDQFVVGYVFGVCNLLYCKIIESKFVGYLVDMLFVVYCVGLYCNGVVCVVIWFVCFGCLVKLMIGGVMGWFDEGFVLSNDVQLIDVEVV